MKKKTIATKLVLAGLVFLGACARMDHLGKAPTLSPAAESPGHVAMLWQGLPTEIQNQRAVDGASLWSGSQNSLLGDRRAINKGDILTVVIQIDEEAERSQTAPRVHDQAQKVWECHSC